MTSNMDLNVSSKICHHDYYGFCRHHKAKDGCPHGVHLKDTCETGSICCDKMCLQQKRHPHICKWFSLQNFCKIKNACRYNHFNISSTILDMKNMLISNAEQIDFLKSSLDELISKSPKKTKPTTKELNCAICNKNFISKSGLTRHIKAKHGEPKIPEFDLFSGQEEEACAPVAPVDINKNKSKNNEN